MARTGPAPTEGAADVTRFIQGDWPKAGAELALAMWIGRCSRVASARLAQQPLPALAGLEFVADDIAAHDGSLSRFRRNFVAGGRRRRRTVRDDRGFRLGDQSRDSIVFGEAR